MHFESAASPGPDWITDLYVDQHTFPVEIPQIERRDKRVNFLTLEFDERIDACLALLSLAGSFTSLPRGVMG